VVAEAILAQLRSASAAATSGIAVLVTALGFVLVTGRAQRPVALAFGAAVALAALTVLSQLSWLGERF